MSEPIFYVDRMTGTLCEEKVYFGELIAFLYGRSFWSRLLGRLFLYGIARADLLSALFGWWNRQGWTRRKIAPFIKKYQVDPSEFADPIDSFASFDAFFTRKLKSESRPAVTDSRVALIPADARYLCYQNMQSAEGFLVKGQKFSLREFLQDDALAERYAEGALVIARLCPTDYHRFHFPFDCTAGNPRQINGYLYSVNPIAIRQNIHIFSQNKRCITQLESSLFGQVLFVEVGATNVGSIHQTYVPETVQPRGAEKGFFSFGASTLVLLFEPGKIKIAEDLLANSARGVEVRCLWGQSLGLAVND